MAGALTDAGLLVIDFDSEEDNSLTKERIKDNFLKAASLFLIPFRTSKRLQEKRLKKRKRRGRMRRFIQVSYACVPYLCTDSKERKYQI